MFDKIDDECVAVVELMATQVNQKLANFVLSQKVGCTFYYLTDEPPDPWVFVGTVDLMNTSAPLKQYEFKND